MVESADKPTSSSPTVGDDLAFVRTPEISLSITSGRSCSHGCALITIDLLAEPTASEATRRLRMAWPCAMLIVPSGRVCLRRNAIEGGTGG
jgi:hypothetical protein